MKKLVILMLLGISLSSCEIYDNDNYIRRHDDRLWSVANELYCYYGIGVIEGLEACVKIDDYIKADDEGRKDSRFSDVGFFASGNRYEIGSYYMVFPDSNSLFETGAVWECFNGNCGVRIECTGENEWTIGPSSKIVDKNSPYLIMRPENISYSAHADLLSRDSSHFCKWKYSVTGTYTEDRTYSAGFSANGMEFWWQASSYHASTSYSLEASGDFETIFRINGKDTDKCVMHNGGIDWDRSVTRL